jgi:hypothetical protein
LWFHGVKVLLQSLSRKGVYEGLSLQRVRHCEPGSIYDALR